MYFDITKVRFKGYLQNLKVGSKGFFAGSLALLKEQVEKDCSVSTLLRIGTSKEPFQTESGIWLAYFYLVEEPKEKRYRPYTWEEREQLRGKWVKWKNTNNKEDEFQIVSMKFDSKDGFIINDGITPELLLDVAKFIDGTPCGVEIEE